VLPEGEPGCGQGSRAFARRVAAGAVVHDASYWCPLALGGPAYAVRAVLEQVQDPMHVADAVSGRCGESLAVLHRQSEFPRGAIGPVLVQHLPTQALPAGVAADNFLHLCLWVHAAAAQEAHRELSVCAAQVPGACLSVLDLRRLEIRGSRASEALASILPPHGTPGLPAALDELHAGESAHLVLPDPRLAKPLALGDGTVEGVGALSRVLAAPPACHLLQPSLPPPASEAAVSSGRGELRQRALGIGAPFAEDVELAIEADALAGGASHFPAVFVRQEGSRAEHCGELGGCEKWRTAKAGNHHLG